MKAKNIFNNALDTYIYLERYVNDGSPSGLTEKQKTSFNTNPFTGKEEFELLKYCDDDCEVLNYGEDKKIFSNGVNYVHPDSIKSDILKQANRKLLPSGIIVAPTASSRTLMIKSGEERGFLKLTYDISKIGGSIRYIGSKACQGSIEASEVIKKHIDNRDLPNTLAIFLETSSKVTKLKLDDMYFEWGTIFRELKPYPQSTAEVQIVPAFSLFSTDINNPDDEYLINQFIKLSNQNPRDYLWNVIKMTLDAHWNLLIKCGVRPEMHCQNCMFELQKDFTISRIIVKDMEDVDKDLVISKYFGHNYKWKCYPHKCFKEGVREYKFRSSYMYDFKLGEYIFTPLIKAVSQEFGLSINEIENQIKEYVRSNYLNLLPKDYFSEDGSWYYLKDIESKPGKEREFFKDDNPKYR